MDAEYTVEEETTYVIANMERERAEDILGYGMNDTYSVVGFEDGTPFLQIGSAIFKGEMDMTLGTSMVFELDENDEGKLSSNVVATTNRVINFRRVNLIPKDRN